MTVPAQVRWVRYIRLAFCSEYIVEMVGGERTIPLSELDWKTASTGEDEHPSDRRLMWCLVPVIHPYKRTVINHWE
jgi:hypothetical protein